MSNVASIVPTKFANLDEKGNETEVAFGFRVFDGYEEAYFNIAGIKTSKQFVKSVNLADPLAVVRRCQKAGDEKIESILDFVRDNETGMYVGDEWREWDEIKAAFDMEEGE
jgi:hypothetical protein